MSFDSSGTKKALKIEIEVESPTVEQDCDDQNRVVGQMKLKMHSKISPNSRRRGGGAGEKKGERANEGEEERAWDFTMSMS